MSGHDHDRRTLWRRAAVGLGPGVRSPIAAVGLLLVLAVTAACAQAPVASLDDGIAAEASSSPTPTTSFTHTPMPAPSEPSVIPTLPSTSDSSSGSSNPDQVLRLGDRGPQVRQLQQRLISLGYWLGVPDGRYGDLTQQAVLALQKAAGLTRDGVLGARTRAALHQQVQPKPHRAVGTGVEVDMDRQLLLVVVNGVPKLILNASTGSGATYVQDGAEQVAVTPTGRFRVFREVNGQDTGPLGPLWRPKYIFGGIAIHGYSSVPAYPASHGCIRVSNAAMDHLWSSGALPIGSSVWVY